MKKRILAAILFLFMVVSLWPITALAEGDEQIGSIQTTGLTIYVNNVCFVEGGALTGNSVNGVSYASGVLTLDGARLDNGYSYVEGVNKDGENVTKNAAIYANGDLTVKLSNENHIGSNSAQIDRAVYTGGKLTLEGSGALIAENVGIGLYCGNGLAVSLTDSGRIQVTSSGEAVYAKAGDIDVNNGSMELQSLSSDWGIGIQTASGNLNIRNGAVDIKVNNGDSGYGYGTYIVGDVTVSGGSIKATGRSDAIYLKGNISVTGGTVDASNGNGIRAQGLGQIKIDGGTVKVGGKGLEATTSICITDGNIAFGGTKLCAPLVMLTAPDMDLLDDMTELRLDGTTFILNAYEGISCKFYVRDISPSLGYNSSAIAYIIGEPNEGTASYFVGNEQVGNNTVTYPRGHLAYTNGGSFLSGTEFTNKVLSGSLSKDGYIFDGWYDNTELSGQSCANYSSGNTYYAKWASEITFDPNGGSGAMDTQQIGETDTTTQLTANSFTKTGYTFTGWDTKEDGTGVAYEDGSTGVGANGSVTLYAQWSPNDYTIIFDGNGAESGSTGSVSAAYDQPVTLRDNGFTKPNFKFAGWDTDSSADQVVYSDGTQALNLTAEANGHVTLYAVWTEKDVRAPDVPFTTTATYNGAEQGLTLEEDYAVAYRHDGQTVTPRNAGTYDVEIYSAETETTAAYHSTIYGGLVINPAPLTITADSKTIYVGGALPEYTYTVTGLMGSDALTTAPALSCNADGKTAGTYAITASGASAGDNYDIGYVHGTLTVSIRSNGGVTGPTSPYTPAATSMPSEPDESDAPVLETASFTDVAADAWYADSVAYVVDKGLFNGTSDAAFSPNDTMTRAMLMTVLARLDGQDTTPAEGRNWYAPGMDWAKNAGISDGADPGGAVTREQLATMLYRYAGEPETAETLDSFTDAHQVSGYAEKAMQWAVENGIVDGKGDGVLAPQGSATRAEVAAMLTRYCQKLGK